MSLLLALTGSSAPIPYVISDNTGSTFSGTEDTYLLEGVPTANFGSAGTLAVKAFNTGDRAHTVIKFTGLASVPNGTVSNAKLRIFCATIGNDPFDYPTVHAYALRRAFVEAQATWNLAATGTNWGTAGALNTANDYDNTLLGSVFVGTEATWYEITGAAVTAYVQAIVSGGADFGLFLPESNFLAPANQFKEAILTSSEGTNGQRPELTFDWVASAGITVALSGTGQSATLGALSSNFTRLLTSSNSTLAQGTIASNIVKLLSGQAQSVTQGQFSQNSNVELVGSGQTLSQGALTPSGSVNIQLTGQSQTLAQGNLISAINTNISGAVQTQAQGAVLSEISCTVSSVLSTFGIGTVNVSANVPLTGQQSTNNQGTLTPSGSVNIQLTGQEQSIAKGNLSASANCSLSGLSSTSATGSLLNVVTKALNSVLSTIGIGNLNSNSNVPIAGSQQAISQGVVSPSGTVNVQLSGQTQSIAQGTLAASITNDLTGGQSNTQLQGGFVTTVTRSITTQASNLLSGVLTPTLATQVQLTGQQQSVFTGLLRASFNKALSGQGSTIVLGNLGVLGGGLALYGQRGDNYSNLQSSVRSVTLGSIRADRLQESDRTNFSGAKRRDNIQDSKRQK